MVLGYTLDEIKKTIIAAVVAIAALVAVFVAFDPSLPEAIVAVVIAAFNVLAVFQSSASAQDIGKTVSALVASGLALIGYFHAFSPDETEQILAAVAAAANVLGVFLVRNGTATA